jgi:anti-sigma regulatory factor (Ser/Thr protein kinase)
MQTLAAVFPCDTRELAHLRRQLTEWLEDAGVSRGLRVRVVLASHEAAANAVLHATPCSELRLYAAIDEQILTVEIADGGRWSGDVVADENLEHGRGIALMKDLMRSVQIHTGPHGTTVQLRHPIL